MADNILYQGRLVVTADTVQAENALKSLQGSLNSLLTNTGGNNKLNSNFKDTLQTVTSLKAALNGAVNTDTGKLNLTKFNQSLIASKTSFSELSSKLKGMGAEGQNAFLQLARSISTAEVPLKKSNTLLENFATTLKNTVKWQISSSIVHGFMGAIQTATGYAKDLNESLNNIRIVTGNSAEEMAKFAKEANKAAKSMGSTTTAYTNASLIYYQQGLSDEEVKKRTDVTVKMANVTKESAQNVSNYMTAIWNNFDNGSKSLEYYADVMTALGAATASSTDEIAAGLEKFAAVADTIGLSYEYATAALATVTAETRQSADVVGNSFKTLFSRIQGLQLGETLDDGTTLNKYSSALNKVGISIKDSNGNLKEMDGILNEMGSKWKTLAKDEQMALAQTVGGVRQYNQLISLMDNWSTFQDNLKTATTASGELQKQADIYAESWEASSKRVRAAAEGIYDSLINEDFFIGVNNILEDTLGVVERLIDSLGGLPGILALISVGMTKAFAPGMAKGITEGLYNLGSGNGNTEAIKQIRQQARDELEKTKIFEQGGKLTSAGVAYKGQADLADADLAFEQYKTEHNVSERQQVYYDEQKRNYEIMNAQRVKNLEELANIDDPLGRFNAWAGKYQEQAHANIDAAQYLKTIAPPNNNNNGGYQGYFSSLVDNDKLTSEQKRIRQKAQDIIKAHNTPGTDESKQELRNLLRPLYEEIQKTIPTVEDLNAEIIRLAKEAGETDIVSNEEIERLKKRQRELEQQNKDLEAGEQQARKNMNPENVDKQKDSIANVGEGLSKTIQGVSELAVGVSAISGAMQALNDDTLSFGEKFTTVLMSAATSIPSVVEGLKDIGEGFNFIKKNGKEAISQLMAMRTARLQSATATVTENGAIGASTAVQTANNAAKATGLALLGKYLIIIGAVVAVVWALVAAYQAARANSIEGQLEKTNKALEETQTAAEEAKTALQELSGAFDNYNNTVKALDECTKGTKEYRDALREANNAALDLLQANPELYSTSGVKTNSEGLIEISKEAQDKLIEDQEKVIANTERSKDFLTARKANLEIQQQTNAYNRDKMSGPSDGVNDTFQDAVVAGIAEAYNVTRTDDSGNVYNMGVQQQIQEAAKIAYSNMEGNYKPNEFIEDVKAILGNGDYAEGIEQFIDEDQLRNWANELAASNIELKTAIEANTAINKLANEQAVKDALGEKAEGKTDAEIAVLGGQLSKEEQNLYDYWYGEGTGWGISQTSGKNNDKVKKIWEAYQEAAGVDYELASNAVLGNDYNRSFSYIGENGQTYEISMEAIASQIASAQASAGLQKFDETEILNKLQNIQLKDSTSGEIFTDYLASGDFSDLDKTEFEQIQGLFTGEDKDEIKDKLDGTFAGLTPEERATIAAAAGAEDWDAYLDGMIEDAQSISQSDFDEVFADLKFTPETGLEAFDGLSLGLQEDIAAALDKAFTVGGEDAVNSLNQMLIGMIGKVEPEAIQQALNFINDYDFKNGSVEDFQQQLSDITNGAIGAGDASDIFAAKMEEAGNRIPITQLGEFIAQLEQLIGLVSDLKIGDIVSDDAIQRLKEMGINIEDFATKTYDGWVLTKQIPTDELQDKAGELYEAGNSFYNKVKDKDSYYTYKTDENGNSTGEIASEGLSAKEFAQLYVGNDNTGYQLSVINTLTEGLEDEIYTLFAGLGDKDYIDQLLNGEGTNAEYDTMLKTLIEAINAGDAGEYNPENKITSDINLANNANDIANVEGFYDENGHISKAGAKGLEGYASSGGEDYADALAQYQEKIAEVGEDTPAATQATEEFYKRIVKIEKNKAAEQLAKLSKELKDLAEGEDKFEETIGGMKKVLDETFGKDISREWIKNNQRIIDQWINGATEAERAFAELQIKSLGDNEHLEDVANEYNKIQPVDLFDIDAESAKSKLEQVYFAIENSIPNGKQILFECTATGDFSQLINQLNTAKVPADQIATLLTSIALTNITPEGFAEVAVALAALQEALESGDPDAIRNAAKEFSKDYQMHMVGDAPNVPPDMRKAGGGGGGGGGSSSREDLMDELSQKQMDVYDKQIQKSEAQRAGLDPEKQSEFIQNEIDLLEEEQEILEKQIGTYKKLMKEKVDAFNEKYAAQGFEIKLTDDGMIANLSELYAQLQAELASTNSDAEARNIEKMMQDLEDATALQSRIDDNVASIADKERQQAEKALEDITQRIDWRIKKIDYQIERLNYYQEKLLLQAHGNKQTIEAMLEGFQYQEQEMLQLFEKGDALRQGISELSAAKAQYPDYEHMFNEQILEYQSDLIDVNMDILELRKEMEELVQSVLDLALEEIDTQTDRLDKYVTMLDHFQNIIDLSGRNMLDQALKVQIGTTKVETMISKMSTLKTQMEGLSEATDLAQKALAARKADGDETSVSFWENQVEVLKQELETATEEFLGSWEEALDSAAELFEMRVELAIANLGDALSPFASLETFQQNYENQKTIMEQYLDDATRLYELNKLNRELNKNIADENDLLSKSKLRDIQQQIFDLQKAGVQMSQFDLDILQKRYDLQLAEIALLEAQNSKTSMRLVRDAAGNWNYVYDADEEKIEDATQKYEDAVYQLDKLAKDYVDDVSQQLIDMQVEYTEALADLDKNSADYQNQVLALQEHYLQRQRYLLEELNKGVEESGMTFHDTLYGQMTDIYSYEDAYDQFLNASNETVGELITNYKDWQSVVESAMNAAGTSWENFGADTEGTLDSLETHIQSLCDEISKLVNVLMSYVNTSIKMVEQWQSTYSKQVDSNIAANEAIIDDSSLHGMTSSTGLSFLDKLAAKNQSTPGFSSGGGWLGGYSGGGGGGGGGDYSPTNPKADPSARDWDPSLSSLYDPREGWCSAWVSSVYGTATGGNIRSGSANEFIINYADKWEDGLAALPDGAIVGFYYGKYGHEMIKVGDHLYGTAEGDTLEKITFDQAIGQGRYSWSGSNIYAYIDDDPKHLEAISNLTKQVYDVVTGQPIENERKDAPQQDFHRKEISFKSGGYTGEFGPDARLAWLHEKEIILNKNDTKNLLEAIKMNSSRSDLSSRINNSIDSQVANMLSSTNSVLASLLRQIQLPVYDTMPIEQKVEINAEFPGVTDHNEIEEALMNLSMDASQYLNLNKNI